jgi:hypothetical protein
MSQREFQTTKAALEKAEAAMRLHGWHLAHGSSDDGVAEAFAAWEAADKALHDGVPAIPDAPTPLDVVTLDRIAREIAANVAAEIDRFYPGALTDRALFNVKAWTRGEVNRWFGPPERGAPDMDSRLRSSGAHRRHLKRLQTLAGTVHPGDALDPILAVVDASGEQARLDYRAGGPVIEGDAAHTVATGSNEPL